MSDYTIREYLPQDIPRLVELWCACFGDPPALAEGFIRSLPDTGTAAVAEVNGHIAGAAYAVCGMELKDASKFPKTVGYIFAVGVNEGYRGQGIGAAVTKAAAELAQGEGRWARIIAVQPAEKGLFDWYKKVLGVECALRRSRYEVAAAAEAEPVMSLSATEYSMWRENMLSGKPHIHLSVYTANAVRSLYSHFGGGFYACSDGIVTADVEGSVCVCKEILCPDVTQHAHIAAAMAAHLGTEKAVYYLPDEKGEAYIAATPGAIPSDCIWNLSMD